MGDLAGLIGRLEFIKRNCHVFQALAPSSPAGPQLRLRQARSGNAAQNQEQRLVSGRAWFGDSSRRRLRLLQQLLKGPEIHRLDEVDIKSRFLRPPLVVVLSPASQGN